MYDVVQEKTISIIKLNQIDTDTFCRISWSDQMSLFVSNGDTARICQIRRREANDASSRVRDLPHFKVEILHTVKLDCYTICGLAPMDKLLVLLAYPKALNTEEQEENKPQLTIIEPLEDDDFNEVSTDYLCLKDYEKLSAEELHLDYLQDDKHYFIVSPGDIFFGKPRDQDDHVDWLLLQEEVNGIELVLLIWKSKICLRFQFEKALSFAETHVKQLRRHSVFQVGRQYLDYLIETSKFEETGKLFSRIFKGEKRLWEDEILKFIRLNKVASIGPFLPLGREKNQIKLDPHVYEAVLLAVLKLEPRRDEVLLSMVREWPPDLYDVAKVAGTIVDQLLLFPDNQTLQRILATLFR